MAWDQKVETMRAYIDRENVMFWYLCRACEKRDDIQWERLEKMTAQRFAGKKCNRCER